MGVPKGQASELERRGGHGESGSDGLIASKTFTPPHPPNKKQSSGGLGQWWRGGGGSWAARGHSETLGVIEMLCILTVVVVL